MFTIRKVDIRTFKSDFEAGDMAVIGADDLEAGTHIFVKLRPCTIRKSTRHCPVRETYFESERQYVQIVVLYLVHS